MLKGIDISSHQGWPLDAHDKLAYRQSDFVIAKATQGTSYVNPCCDPAIQQARRDKKLIGVYHYVDGSGAIAEADYFLKHCEGYLHKAVLALDFEEGSNRSWGDYGYVWKMARRIHDKTGVWPMVYVQASEVRRVANCAKKCALWLAGYPDFRDSWTLPQWSYATAPWGTWTIWQYTDSGGNLDRNYAQLTARAWRKVAGATIGKKAAAKAKNVAGKAKPKANVTKQRYIVKTTRYLYPTAKADKTKRVLKLTKGTVVEATGKSSGDWIQVRYAAKTGWVKMHAAAVRALG